MASLATREPPSITPAEFLQNRFSVTRENLIAERLYISDVAFRDTIKEKLTWARVRHEETLVTKASLEALQAAQKAAQETDVEGSTPPHIPPLDVVNLSIVVEITTEDFWMTSCGLWKGPNRGCNAFSDMKLTCTGAKPTHAVFSPDYPTAIGNLKYLMDIAATEGFNNKKGLLAVGLSNEQKVNAELGNVYHNGNNS
ncbi:hypothetical protein H0H81_001803 [Sphagnurus paluster]|uniref:Uncharacterized protein n=1 Tax=Sphagnurus paluster TaxID=117069 RepID=A0A9P7K1M4_9AGAR|nr:hypothetical protein H0H81_001803 [Sphagnurus paluster]